MGSAESEVGSTAAELQVIPTFLMNAPRPLIKWSGNQPCDPSAEREVHLAADTIRVPLPPLAPSLYVFYKVSPSSRAPIELRSNGFVLFIGSG